jgi:CBS domain-containing protein
MPPVARAGDDVLHVAKLAVNAPLPRAVYVVDEDERLLGVISDARLGREVFAHLDSKLAFDPLNAHSMATLRRLGEDAATLTAGSLMEAGLKPLGEGETLAGAMRALYEAGRDELPVVNGEGRLVGVVRALDILREWIEDTLQVRLGDETESFY